MMADFIIAADTAKFGQPEIKLGVTPGMGGSQRLTWAVGKAKAMEMCLTGRMMGAEEAERSGLVAKVVPAAELARRSAQDRRDDRRHGPARRHRHQGNGQCRVRDGPGAGHQFRAPPVPRPVRHRGPEGRHGRLRREAAGQVEGRSRHRHRQIAFIGLGNMGGGMAANLVKAGHEVPPSISPSRRSSGRAAMAARSRPAPPKPVKGADAVVTMLPAGKHVAAVYRDSVFGKAPKPAPS